MLGMSRREIVGAVLVGSAVAVAVGKTAETLTDPGRRFHRKGSGHPDAEVFRLCDEWHTAKATGDALYVQVQSLDDERRLQTAIDAATDWLADVEEGLEALPARTLEGVRAKARVVQSTGHGGADLASAIIRDLLAMEGVA
ncbi:hypothetical protein [Roseomonas mucosa]|uniref:hypothetical protein n=1 Tax=Roseomonas mucosa TaxID=207340 RepID=UPI000AC9387A|nr:hypothetical protein [Roseomonas mucosa]